MDNINNKNKQLFKSYQQSLYDYDQEKLAANIATLFAPNAILQMCFPFETLAHPDDLVAKLYQPLQASMPDLERRDFIIMAGESNQTHWVGCAGYYTGTFLKPWLTIPPTHRQMRLRFHEFYRFVDNKIVEMQAIWDIPDVMLQANAWPLSPSLGLEWHVPGPATHDGLISAPYAAEKSAQSAKLVSDMLTGLSRFASEGVDAMELSTYWHPKMNWYGPSLIGTNRLIDGFRRLHQIPFLAAMPNREVSEKYAKNYLFGDGDYVGFTGWPGMSMRLSGDGWLGIAPNDKKLTMRSLDFWRCEAGKIRENWVLIDILSIYDQLGVDVFRRMHELTRGMNGVDFDN